MLYNFINKLKNIILDTDEFTETNDEIENIKKYTNFKLKNYLPKFYMNNLQTYIILSLYILMVGLNIEGDRRKIFLDQLSMNNDRNFLAIVNLFLPYLDDKNDNENQKNITDLKKMILDLNNDNKAKFSNFIYDHNNISDINFEKKKNIKQLEIISNHEIFLDDEIYLKTIFYFVVDTFNRIRYKFYINWINSFPLTIDTYKNSNLYKNSFNYNLELDKLKFGGYMLNFPNLCLHDNLIDKTKIVKITNEPISEVEDLINLSYEIILFYNGINLEDIYNSLVNDYYFSIKPNKWLFFEFDNEDKINILIYILHNIFDINLIIQERSWYMLNNQQQNNFKSKWINLKEAIKKKKFYL